MLLHSKRMLVAALLVALPAETAWAGNYGESVAWQFQTTNDKANLAFIQDLILKRQSGYYAPPIYTTNIDRQFNCNVTASSVGNNGTNSTVANSPSTSGANADATGNSNSTDIHGGSTPGSAVNGTQGNSGQISSTINGGTKSYVRGDAWQALNSTQTNSGNQTSNVNGSTACTFGALN